MISDRLKAFRSFAEIALACIGCALIAAAAAANQAWFDRHVLPSFWTPREEIVRTEMIVRAGIAALGALIVFLSGKAGPALRHEPLFAFTITLAIVLALGATELILRTTRLVAVP